MLSYRLEHEVLVITVEQDPGIGGRAGLASRITDLVDAHRPSPVVVVIDDRAAGSAAASAVLRAHRFCARLGILMSVVTHSAPLRRLLEADGSTRGHRLVVHARTDTAIAGSFAAAA